MSILSLKIIAIITMLIDHIALTFYYELGPYAFYMRSIGRIAFPLFIFMIAEGCRHTRDIKRYAFGLGAFAIISEIPYDMWLSNTYYDGASWFNTADQNIFFTLFLGVCAIAWLKRPKKHKWWARILDIVVVAALVWAGNALNADYGSTGVAAIVLCYIMPNKYLQSAVLLCSIIVFNFGFTYRYAVHIICGAVSAVLVLFYNGERGKNPTWLKWFFYIFYPLHITVLYILYKLLS